MFIRRKYVRGKAYFYLVESYRDESGNPRQRVVDYLGDYDCAVAATANRPDLRKKLVKNITTEVAKPRTQPSEADELRQAIARLQDEINQLKSRETKQNYAIEMLKEFCELEDKKPYTGGSPKTEPAWVILNDEKPSSRWSKLALFYQWVRKLGTTEEEKTQN
jgi:hypothetical protein